MPIRPSERHRYPKDWKSVRQRILERAGHRCEFCGVENGAIGRRKRDGSFERLQGMEVEAAAFDSIRLTRIVLTIAHLDHTPENNANDNLRALCQRCHLAHDRPHHLRNARLTRLCKLDSARPILADLQLGGTR
jgi:hypothetical protein